MNNKIIIAIVAVVVIVALFVLFRGSFGAHVGAMGQNASIQVGQA